MARTKRKIISIIEEKCNGCGLCLAGCPEGALEIVGGKARLVKESFCDGLGACLGECPQGALVIEDREADAYDVRGVLAHLKEKSPELVEKHLRHMREHGMGEAHDHAVEQASPCTSARVFSGKAGRLRQWPIKLRLIPPGAPFLKDADLVLIADCVPLAYTGTYDDFLDGRAIATGCPKLGDVAAYETRLKEILEQANIKSLEVIHMEVPCCSGLVYIARKALVRAGKDLPVVCVTIGIQGQVKAAGEQIWKDEGTSVL